MIELTIADVEIFRDRVVLFLDVAPPGLGQSREEDAPLLRINWEGAADESGSVVLVASRLRLLSDGRLRAIIELPALRGPLRAVLVQPLPAVGALHFLKGHDARLARIFPATDEEYVATMQSHLTRWGNLKTRFFLAEQVVRFFEGAPEHRIGAALIMAYKAVELADEACIQAARTAVEASFAMLDRLPIDWHPRRNPEHLRISLFTALWHLDLAVGRVAEARATLHSLLAASLTLGNYASTAYSASKGLLLLGWLEWRAGDTAQARHCWEQTVAMFKNAVRDADPYKAVLFRELTHSLDAAYQAGLCLRALGPRPANQMPALGDILSHATRVPLASREHMEKVIDRAFQA